MIHTVENTPVGTKAFVNGKQIKAVVGAVTLGPYGGPGFVTSFRLDSEGNPMMNAAHDDLVRMRTWGWVRLEFPVQSKSAYG